MLRLVLGFLPFLRNISPFHAFTSSSRRPFVIGNVARREKPSPRFWSTTRSWPRPLGGLQRSDASVDQVNDGGGTKAESTSLPLSDERKATLFQFLLRDLQVEGVPLLSVDVPDVDRSPLAYAVLQAALWTTMAELADQQNQESSKQQERGQDSDEEDAAPILNRACLVMENVPVPDLQRFVDHFEISLKGDARTAANFPELGQIRWSLVGKGVGPGLLVEATNASSTRDAPTTDSPLSPEREQRALAAMKMFVDRAGISLEDSDVNGSSNNPASLQYRTCSFRDAYHIHSSFWNCVCETLQSATNDQQQQQQQQQQQPPPATYLLLPELDDAMPVDDQQERFDVLTSMLTQSLELYAKDTNDAAVDVVYYAPHYDRNKIRPANEYVRGHLPPLTWLEQDASVDDDAYLVNYQRRSPVTACLLRYPSVHGSNVKDETDEASTTSGDLEPSSVDAAAKLTLRVHRQLVRQTLEQAALAERDVARG